MCGVRETSDSCVVSRYGMAASGSCDCRWKGMNIEGGCFFLTLEGQGHIWTSMPECATWQHRDFPTMAFAANNNQDMKLHLILSVNMWHMTIAGFLPSIRSYAGTLGSSGLRCDHADLRNVIEKLMRIRALTPCCADSRIICLRAGHMCLMDGH